MRRRSESLSSRSTCSITLVSGDNQIVDGLLPRVDIGGRLGARFAQPRLGQCKNAWLFDLQRLGRHRLKRLAHPRFGLGVGLEPLGMHRALFRKFGVESVDGRPTKKPARHGSGGNGKRDESEE